MSRIPKPQQRAPSSSKLQSPSIIYNSLRDLGCPVEDPEELSRLCQGQLGDVLNFVVGSVRGRRGCEAARSQLTKLHGSKEREWTSTDISQLQTTEKRAERRLASAQDAHRSLLTESSTIITSVAKSEKEVDQLESSLDGNRRVELMLEVLERKEEIRTRRFEELASLLDHLKNSAAASDSVQTPGLSPPPKHDFPLPQINSTKDKLTALHAYHVQLSTLVSQSSPSQSAEDIEAIRQLLGSDELLERVLEGVDRRAAQVVKFDSSSSSDRDTVDLASLAKVKSAKKEELQALSDRSIALGYHSKQLIDMINTFNGTTAPTLRSSLTAALSQTMGYIDNLHGLIAESQDIPEETNTFRDEVKDAVGLYGNVTDETLMKRVEYLLIQAHRRDAFLEGAALIDPLEMDEDLLQLIEKFHAEEARRADMSLNLLRRKVAKTDNALVEDIEALIGETTMITRL